MTDTLRDTRSTSNLSSSWRGHSRPMRDSVPRFGSSTHGRDRKRPVFRADVKYRASVILSHQTVHLLIFLAELLPFQLVLDFVARRRNFLTCSQDRFHSLLILILYSLKKSARSF